MHIHAYLNLVYESAPVLEPCRAASVGSSRVVSVFLALHGHCSLCLIKAQEPGNATTESGRQGLTQVQKWALWRGFIWWDCDGEYLLIIAAFANQL